MWKRGHSRQAPSNTKSQRLEWPLLLKPDPPSPYGAAFVHSRLSHPRPSGFPPGPIGEISGMANVRLIKHEAVPNCGSCEVRFPDGGPSKYFYWDDLPEPPAQAGPAHQRGCFGAGQGVREGAQDCMKFTKRARRYLRVAITTSSPEESRGGSCRPSFQNAGSRSRRFPPWRRTGFLASWPGRVGARRSSCDRHHRVSSYLSPRSSLVVYLPLDLEGHCPLDAGGILVS